MKAQFATSILSVLLLQSTALAAPAAQQCYNLNGKPSPYAPCPKQRASQPYVACCGTGDICLSSGVCLYENAVDARGLLRADGCTDPTLKDSSCQPWAAPVVARWNTTSADTGFLAVLGCSSGKYCAIPATLPALSGDETVGDDCCDPRYEFSLSTGKSLGKPGSA